MTSTKPKKEKARKQAITAGGSATGGGVNFQAAVTAIVEVHIAVGKTLDWLSGITHDVPVSVLAETGGPGDDIALQFEGGLRAEVQVKRGLTAGKKMWEAILKLAAAINEDKVDYGVLVVCPNSSGTIKNELARDLERLAGGREDGLKEITKTFVGKLKDTGLAVDKVAKRFRIVTLSCLATDSDAIRGAKAWLGHICESANETDRAWNALYLDGARLIEYRGARAADSVAQLLRSEGIALKSGSKMPSAVLDYLCAWTVRTTSSFSIPGLTQALAIDEAWLRLDARVVSEKGRVPTDLAEALEHYHSWGQGRSRRDEGLVAGESLGRFRKHCVLIGGPGMGKSTLLKRLARIYAKEGLPVLRCSARALAQRMRSTGCSFEEGIVALGTDGSGLSLTQQAFASSVQWVVLCDALDEAGGDQEIVCEGLLRFSEGYPQSRIVVTTRPIGYDTVLLRAWQHYELQPFGEGEAERHIEHLVRTAVRDSNQQKEVLDFSKAQIDQNRNAKLAARSPLLLGLMSALAIQGVPFGNSRVQFYERLFGQMEKARGNSAQNGDLSSATLAAYLDVLAWEMLHDRAATTSTLNHRCGEYLATVLSELPLKARAIAEQCFRYWERVGMVEKISHAGIEVATFIHKTFGEYAAARHLSRMPKEEARKIIGENMAHKEWSEIFAFSCSLGLVDTVLEEKIGSHEHLGYEMVTEALTMMALSEVQPSRVLQEKIFGAAARYLNSPIARESISTGARLVELAKTYLPEVVDVAKPLVDSEQPCTRLGARALMTFGGMAACDDSTLKQFVSELPSLAEEVSGKSYRRNLFDFDASPSQLINVVYAFAFREVLGRFSRDEAGEVLRPLCVLDRGGTLGGMLELLRILDECDRPDLAELLQRPMKNSWFDGENWLSVHDEQFTAFFNALRLQFSEAEPLGMEGGESIFWQLSGFLCAVDFWQVPMGMLWIRNVKPDDEVIQEVVRGCVGASGVDRPRLAREVAAISEMNLRASDENGFLSPLFQHTRLVHTEMNWSAVQQVDLPKLEAALHYPSAWAGRAAVELILVNSSEDELSGIVGRVFGAGRGDALWLAAQLCLQLPEHIRLQLLLDRLEKPLVPGCQHLYAALAQEPLPLSNQLLRILRNALLVYNGPRTATAAAQVAERYVAESDEIKEMLAGSFEAWREKEEPYPVNGGTVPDSPREQILKVLLKRDDFDKFLLLHYVNDTRRNVADVAADALLQALSSGMLRNEFLDGLDNGSVPPHLLKRALKQKVNFESLQLQLIRSFLTRSSTELQRAAMSLLLNDYLSSNEIRECALSMQDDPDLEVRELARRQLAS